ncbi:MAG TPA: cytidylate kinase family protein [Candidatus Acidoferrales bacterium]|nr:cytidylate kinase family protein [Candidatus Acidoferrales bacterium]
MDTGARRGFVITVGGPHGTGKSTYALALARALGLRYVSAGGIFRELAKKNNASLESYSRYAEKDPEIDRIIDERTKEEARHGSVVIDAQLAAWMVRELADLKMLLTAPDQIRFTRIAQRDGITIEMAQKETEAREEIQIRRYKQYYGIDVTDLSIYDLRIDTSLHPIQETKAIVIEEATGFLAKKGKQGTSV